MREMKTKVKRENWNETHSKMKLTESHYIGAKDHNDSK